MHNIARPPDWIARVLGIAGLAISLLTFYFSSWRPACIRIGLGPQIFVASKPRIGVLTTVVNEGAHEVVITSGELEIDNSQFTLPLTSTALQSESWEYDTEGNRQKQTSIRYSFFTPFAVKPHDEASASLWFVATDTFQLTPGRHVASVVLRNANHGSVSLQFEIELKQSDLTALYPKKNGKEQAGVEYPIDIVSQMQKSSCPLF